jgi:hypothetical protein
MMDTVLFTDHGVVVFAITATAIALLLSVLGLATTQQIRCDIRDQLCTSGDPILNEWISLRDQFNAVRREGADSVEDMYFDAVSSPLQRIGKPSCRAVPAVFSQPCHRILRLKASSCTLVNARFWG